MKNYLKLINEVWTKGDDRITRNGAVRSMHNKQLRFDLQRGFPLQTTRKLDFDNIKGELLWFLEGSGDERRLAQILDKDITIWTDNALADYWKPKANFVGDLGRVYGVQWRSWRTTDDKGNTQHIDQLEKVLTGLKLEPYGRRHVVTAWNPGELDQMALPPCHMMFQFYLSGKGLCCSMTQRSADLVLGVPYNIASYALLTHLVARQIGKPVDELVITMVDCHIYHDHFPGLNTLVNRKPMKLCELRLNPDKVNVADFGMQDIEVGEYVAHEPIKFKMAV